MNVALKGSSPATMAAGILLLSRARTLGQRLTVSIVGDPDDIGVVTGPAILYSPALASCGVGRELGNGATVIVPGPVTESLAVTTSAGGIGGWFLVDRSGTGVHPATQAILALRRDPRVRARWLAQQIVLGVETLGGAAEPAAFDVLFGAPVAPLTRLAIALRAARAITQERGEPVTKYLLGNPPDDESPLNLPAALARLQPEAHEAITACLRTAEILAAEDGGRETPMVESLTEILLHLAMLPEHGILPPLDPATDAVAFNLGKALGPNQGNPAAHQSMLSTYRFLGGKFTTSAPHAVSLPSEAPPPDRLGRWMWFCSQVEGAAAQVERVWRDIVDPPQ